VLEKRIRGQVMVYENEMQCMALGQGKEQRIAILLCICTQKHTHTQVSFTALPLVKTYQWYIQV
jgi:hypothetical protein